MNLQGLSALYKENLFGDVIPFWLRHSGDYEDGGYYTCLTRQGAVYDTDKFMWLQGRQVWTFAMLYNEFEQHKEWLDFAELGAKFMVKNGMDEKGNWFFSLDKTGRPLTKAYDIFSDCFAAMAFAQMSKATGNELYADISRNTFHNILYRLDNPNLQLSSDFSGTRDLKSFTPPMILTNLVLEVEAAIDPALVSQVIDKSVDEVMNKFYRSDLGVTLENITVDNRFSDSFEGRLVNPGHGLEAMWFIMDIAKKRSDASLMDRAVDSALSIMEFGWDKEYGGIFYFLDVKGSPPQQLEWDQKLWWVHLESMITMLKGYLHTGNEKCLSWFEKLHNYSFPRFADPAFGEWFGYLSRRGEILFDLKGGKWKGCFHVPRGLYQIYKTIDEIVSKGSFVRDVEQ